MTRDSDRRDDDVDRDEESGASEERKSMSTVPDVTSGEEAGESELQAIQIVLVDEMLEIDTQKDIVDTPEQPNAYVSHQEVVQFGTVDSTDLGTIQIEDEVDIDIEPTRLSNQISSQIGVSVTETLQSNSVTQKIANQIKPQKETSSLKNLSFSAVQNLTTTHTKERVDQKMTLEQQRSRKRGKLEIDEDDPVFGWAGGSPYESVRPKFVIHRSKDEINTLPFLQLLLRDTYKELEGGEPGAETVEFVANEPRIPQIQKNIVTLDLTGSESRGTMRNDAPIIERNNVDIVPKLKDVASTLYTGELGYFVLSLPDDWEGDVIRRDFFDALVTRVSEGTATQDDGDGIFEKVRSSPVVMATPRVDTDAEFNEKVIQYFSLSVDNNVGVDVNSKRYEGVAQLEEVYERALRRNDWARIAMARRQKTEKESDEHYFWKALLADGLARKMKQWFEREQTDSEVRYETFILKNILREDIIKTEHTVREQDDETVVADLYLDSQDSIDWIGKATAEFFDIENKYNWNIAIEFETGRSEGAFNFRKFRESVEKYADADVEQHYIFVVVPARLFYRGERRAEMILDLVMEFDEREKEPQLVVDVLVPVVENGYCRGFQSGRDFLSTLYRGEE